MVIACILYVFSRCITSLDSVDALRLVSAWLRERLGLFAGSLHGYKIERSFLKLDDLHSGTMRSCSTWIDPFVLVHSVALIPNPSSTSKCQGRLSMEVTEQSMIIADG